jgi:hypothetical protein
VSRHDTVLVTSAHEAFERLDRGEQFDPNPHLEKPFDAKVLLALVDQVIKSARD